MIEFRLPTWKETIHVDSLLMDRTYAGMLEGRPDEGLNQRLIIRSFEIIEKLWGKDRPTHVIPPAIDRREPAHPLLPKYRCIAWLSCWHPVKDEEDDGSNLFAIWFQNEGHFSTDAMEFMLRELDWKGLAKDFSH